MGPCKGEQSMKIISVVFVLMMVMVSVASAGQGAIISEPTTSVPDQSGADTGSQTKEAAGIGKSEGKPSPLSAYKINYFTANSIPTDSDAQIKFQISAKYRVFNWEGRVPGGTISPYFAYSQKSLWNYGESSKPFEESNYNPEFFVDYRTDSQYGDFMLRNIIFSPFEHESNGLDGTQSRSWNRAYIAVRTGLYPIEEDGTGSPLDRIELVLKLWHAWGYSDQDAHLRSIGSSSKFLDYAGRGEVELTVRNILLRGAWGNQVNVTTRIFHDGDKNSVNFEYLQKIKNWHIIPYFQYWYGYNETLLRFDQLERRTFVGLAFGY